MDRTIGTGIREQEQRTAEVGGLPYFLSQDPTTPPQWEEAEVGGISCTSSQTDK